MTEKYKKKRKVDKTDGKTLMSVLDTKSELRKVHLSRNDLLGHRVDAQGARVTGLNTPALQEKNQQPPPVTQSARTQNTSQGKMLPLPLPPPD